MEGVSHIWNFGIFVYIPDELQYHWFLGFTDYKHEEPFAAPIRIYELFRVERIYKHLLIFNILIIKIFQSRIFENNRDPIQSEEQQWFAIRMVLKAILFEFQPISRN